MQTLAAIIILALTVTLPAGAQQSPAQKPVRVLIANGKLGDVAQAPIYMKLLQVQLAAGQSVAYSGANAMVYPLSGTLVVESESESKTLQDGDGVFLEAGKNVTLKAGGSRPTVFFEFLLITAAELSKLSHPKAAVVTELYQTTEPIKGLKPGPHEFTLTRVIAPPKLPAPPMHHRSGAALYYVLAGSGIVRTPDKSEPRARGAIQYEPSDFVHSWQNAADSPLILLQANISAEGTPEIIFLQ
jgi:quercetin dioxygenase-like cupin family protein